VTTTLVADGSHVNACICQSNTDASNSGVTICGVSGVSGVIGHGISPTTAAGSRVAGVTGNSHDVASGCGRSTVLPMVVDVDALVCRQPACTCPGSAAVTHCFIVTGTSDGDDVSDDVTIEAPVHAQTITTTQCSHVTYSIAFCADATK